MQAKPMIVELSVRLPRSKKRRIIMKWLKSGRGWVTTLREQTAEDEREHEEWHRLHGEPSNQGVQA